MRKFRGTRVGKRVLSAALALGMVVAMLPIANLGIRAKADVTSDADLKFYTSQGKDVIRGAVDLVTDLPQFGKDVNTLKVGTAAKPFTILEVVPYEEYSEFGYLIGGCEPMKVEEMHGDANAINYVNSFNAANVRQVTEPIYFFEDEPEGKKDFYGNRFSDKDWNDNCKNKFNYQHEDNSWYEDYVKVKGYYQIVEDGEGWFEVQKDPSTGKKSIVKKSGGNVIWHSLYPNVDGDEYSTVPSFSMDINTASFSNVGDKLYTTRSTSDSLKAVYVANYYYSYCNEENFLIDTIGLTWEEAEAYSVVIKVITPDQLNADTRWIEYADLIYISAKPHGGLSDENAGYWEKYNRLGHTLTADRKSNGFLENDFSWNTVKAILDKNTRERNYAAIVLDNTLYEGYDSVKKSVNITPYDFNLDPIVYTKDGRNQALYQEDGINTNLYKLIMMLVSINPNIVQQVFLPYLKADQPNDGNSKIKLTLQTGDAQTYWGDHVFQLVDSELYAAYNTAKGGYVSVLGYLTDPNNAQMLWDAYNYSGNFHTERQYVQNRTYTYNGDTSIAQQFRSGTVGSTDSKFKDFDKYVRTDEDTKKIWENNHPTGDYSNVTGKTSPPSAALRYILGFGKDFEFPTYGGEIHVLDVEPSVGLRNFTTPLVLKDAPNWKIKESYIRMLLPNFTGNVIIDHMTMSSFIGRTNDLNSEYDMIYLGSDSNGFHKTDGVTDFNDDGMDGLIYFHNGDLITTKQEYDGWGPTFRNVNFVSGVTDASVRFPGNDITKVKIDDLVDYLKSGLPIVADAVLYQAGRVDPYSNIYGFLNTYNANSSLNPLAGISGVYLVSQSDLIEERLRSNRIEVTFTELPKIYKDNDESSYLSLNAEGNKAVLRFGFDVKTPNKYAYRIYVDQNRDGKFVADEIAMNGIVDSLHKSITASVSQGIVGLVQWRIEVYDTANEMIRDSREGSSAVKCYDPSKKNDIKVLQIGPDSNAISNLTVDLTSQGYKQLYDNLDAFNVEVTRITWSEFERYFEGSGFKFNMGSPIDVDTNPSVAALAAAVDDVDKDGNTISSGRLDRYNMIVVGFADNYGTSDLSDRNGAADFLYYYAAIGKSILFTHDNTSFFNSLANNDGSVPAYKDKVVAGYTSNAMLRDLMGMNRYGMVSTELSKITDAAGNQRGYLSAELEKFRARTATDYPGKTSTGEEIKQTQGYTYAALLRLGKSSYTCPYDKASFNALPVYSTLAVQLNEGQITQYPYNIDEKLTVGQTHSQYYQANMEDPELTVWYTLENPASYGMSGNGSVAYAVSPQDAANNYYIYSKGNVFYTGVGHSDTSREMEKKLFVNTMIAAYRAAYEAPGVVITNPEANKVSSDTYTIRVPRDFNYDSSGNLTVEEFVGSSVKVMFRPEDASFSNTIKCRIYYSDASIPGSGTIISRVYDAYGNEYVADPAENFFLKRAVTDGAGNVTYKYLDNGADYWFNYARDTMNAHPNLTFEVWNDRFSTAPGLTYLKFLPQPLFKLD